MDEGLVIKQKEREEDKHCLEKLLYKTKKVKNAVFLRRVLLI